MASLPADAHRPPPRRLDGFPALLPPQRRVLESGLRYIERELAELDVVLGGTYTGPMVSFDDDLGGGARESLERGIHEARERIGQLRDRFGLAPARMPKSRWIAGQLAQLSVHAEECQSRYLRGYGALAPDLPATLDPLVHRLTELLLAMQRVARGVPAHEAGIPIAGPDGGPQGARVRDGRE